MNGAVKVRHIQCLLLHCSPYGIQTPDEFNILRWVVALIVSALFFVKDLFPQQSQRSVPKFPWTKTEGQL